MKKIFTYLILCMLLFVACTEKETITITDNEPPSINNVPSIRIQNYVNRVFIDLIGREPLDEEMEAEVAALREADLSKEARIALISKLQTDTAPVFGDTSHKKAYYQQIYILAKIRCLEGISDSKIYDLSNDDEASLKADSVLSAKLALEQGDITIAELFARMVDNAAYDFINMNSFNFVNATFDNLLWRFPTRTEFNAGFDMVEYEKEAMLFESQGANKEEYIDIIVQSREMYEGLIIWGYQMLLARRPTTEETSLLFSDFLEHQDFALIQQEIMSSNEYANF